jgi:hypothetical protein
MRAIPILDALVKPRRKSGVRHSKPDLSPLALQDLSSVLDFFRRYAEDNVTWEKASLDIAKLKGHRTGHARTLRTWGRACLLDPSFTPRTSYGLNHDPVIEHDDFQKDLEPYLHEVGKYIKTDDIIQFTSQPEIQERWGLTKPVSSTTAKRWMCFMDYRWRREPKGMYIDGHERQDVVEYRQKVFLQAWKKLEPRMQSFASFEISTHMDPIIRRIIAWFHDECTFHANDRRMLVWVLMLASRKPSKKGEGLSLMVSDIVSAEYGFMASPDG